MTSDFLELRQKLGLDEEAHDKILVGLAQAYGDVYLSQKNRPEGMSYLDSSVAEAHRGRTIELNDLKEAGGKVVGAFCLYVPEEIVIAADAACVGICGGSPWTCSEAEAVLPRNLCPMIKSLMSFKIGKVCPYYETSDMVVGETTCDGKKKAYEILGELTNVHVMQSPQMKDDASRILWLGEVKKFKTEIEELTGNRIGDDQLAKGIAVVNAKRKALKRMNEARKASPVPISGKDALLIEQIALIDEPIRFTEMINRLSEELEQRIADGVGVADKDAPRILVSGCPMALPNWKLHNIVEATGAIVVGEEACIGHRYFRDVVDESAAGVDEKLEAIADRYMKLDCACFTPNKERIDNILKLVEDYNVDGVIHYTLQFCDPFAVEYFSVERALKDAGIPVLQIETDYSKEDAGQISTRVEAFLETIKGAQGVVV